MGIFRNGPVSIQFKKVLYTTDFSDLSLTALPHALKLVECFGARLYCLHVVDDGYQYWSALGPEGIPIGPPPEEMIKLARERMATFAQEHLAGSVQSADCEVATGRPFTEIIAYAREQEIDLIVMATHGRGAVVQMLLGSTTEKVVRKSPCAVLTVRPEGHEFVMP